MISATHWQLVIWYIGSVGSLVFLPFMAAILAEAGHSEAELARMMIWMPIALTIGAPAWSWLADFTGRADRVLQASTALALLASVAFLFTENPSVQTLCLATIAIGRAPFGPLGDALTLKRLEGDHRSYGQLRMWGSVVYLIAILIGGLYRSEYPSAPLWMGCGLLVFALGFAWTLPSDGFRIERAPKGILKPLLKQPFIWLFLVLSTLHGLTITTYDNFFSLHVEQMGWSPSVTGFGIATGVMAEVFVLGFGKVLLNRIGPKKLILIGVASTLPRFWFTGTVESAEVIVLLQSLHGLGFGTFWIGGVAFLSEIAPKEAPNATQSLLPASAFGAGYLMSMSLASTVFQWIKPAELFQYLGVGSLLTVGLTLLFVMWKPKPT